MIAGEKYTAGYQAFVSDVDNIITTLLPQVAFKGGRIFVGEKEKKNYDVRSIQDEIRGIFDAYAMDEKNRGGKEFWPFLSELEQKDNVIEYEIDPTTNDLHINVKLDEAMKTITTFTGATLTIGNSGDYTINELRESGIGIDPGADVTKKTIKGSYLPAGESKVVPINIIHKKDGWYYLQFLSDYAISREANVVQDSAMQQVGGIDLNPKFLDLQIERDGKGIPLPMNMQKLDQMNIEGFMPIIINIAPVTNLPMLLGFDPDAKKGNPVDVGDNDGMDPADRKAKIDNEVQVNG
jgi:hypothetical protein